MLSNLGFAVNEKESPVSTLSRLDSEDCLNKSIDIPESFQFFQGLLIVPLIMGNVLFF